MHKFFKHALGQLCIAGMLTGVASAATDVQKLNDRIDSATAVIHELMGTPDKGVPQWVAAKAKCVAVVPGYKKGAFVLGGQYGQGLATCRTAHGWSAPVFMQITGASFGLQAGGQSTDLVLVGTNHKSMQDMMKEKVKLGGDAIANAVGLDHFIFGAPGNGKSSLGRMIHAALPGDYWIPYCLSVANTVMMAFAANAATTTCQYNTAWVKAVFNK